jgi:DNA-binding response OmpR family regulator
MKYGSILIVDDDRELGEMLSEYLNKSDFRVTTATDGLLAADLVVKRRFDLIILDVMLPSLSGFDVLKRIRERLTVPVIMLTARGEDADCVLGLELGADDYLSKPFSLQQLTARVRAVLRRTVRPSESPEQSHSVGPLTLFPATLTVQLRGKRLALTGTEYRLLETLLTPVAQTQSREYLTEHVLGRCLSAYDRSIDTHISNLRKKLSAEEGALIEIRNIRGAGYVLVCSTAVRA